MRSDLSAVHRIDPIRLESMPAPLIYSLIYRLSAYQSVTRGLWLSARAETTSSAPSRPQEMKAGEWLASRPRAVLDQISKTPIRKG